jgi:hypothetical protein
MHFGVLCSRARVEEKLIFAEMEARAIAYVRLNEVNYTMEYRNSIPPTRVNIPGRIIDYTHEVAQGKRSGV